MSVTSLVEHKRSAMLDAISDAPPDARILIIVSNPSDDPKRTDFKLLFGGWSDPLALYGAVNAAAHAIYDQFFGSSKP